MPKAYSRDLRERVITAIVKTAKRNSHLRLERMTLCVASSFLKRVRLHVVTNLASGTSQHSAMAQINGVYGCCSAISLLEGLLQLAKVSRSLNFPSTSHQSNGRPTIGYALHAASQRVMKIP
jgi:hypothetical protein